MFIRVDVKYFSGWESHQPTKPAGQLPLRPENHHQGPIFNCLECMIHTDKQRRLSITAQQVMIKHGISYLLAQI